MYPDGNYSIKDNKLNYVKQYTLLCSFSDRKRYFWLPYFFLNFFITTGQLIYLFQAWGDLMKMMGITVTVTVELQTIYKLLLLYYHKERIHNMHNCVDNEFWDYNVVGKGTELKLIRRMKLINMVLVLHWSHSTFVAALVMAFPLTKYPPEIRELPIQSWFPFDTNPSPLHEILYLILALNGLGCISTIGTFDYTFVYFAQQLLIQFKLLKEQLKNLTKGVTEVNDYLYKVHDKMFQKEVYRRMAVCIEHHTKLLRFGRELETFCSLNIALQMVCSLMTFVIIGFILTTTNQDITKSCKLVLYFIVISLHTTIFAWHGSELQFESSSVANAAYLCEWYLSKAAVRRGLVCLQMNAVQREIKLSGLGCWELNNNSLLTLYQTAFSCITLLQSINED